MEKQFVTFDIALKLKYLDFDEKCFAYFHNRSAPYFCGDIDRGNFVTNKKSRYILYDDDCTASLWQQVFDWFREKHSIIISIRYFKKVSRYEIYIYNMYGHIEPYTDYEQEDYYKARELAILKGFEFIENQ